MGRQGTEGRMKAMQPADELAEVREELARLRLREAQLRALLVARPELARQGRWTRVEMEERLENRLDPALMPENLRGDPAFRRTVPLLVLRCLPLPRQTLRPGWPIRRGGVLLH